MPDFDVIILGAGAAGMMAAIEAGRRGRRVLVIDHASSPGEKIRISGGGRCNFTNVHATATAGRDRFLSRNPRFALSALSRYTPQMFMSLVRRYNIPYHEKTLGQLFCDNSSLEIINLLQTEMTRAGAVLSLSTTIDGVEKTDDGFRVGLSNGPATATSLIVATGGKSIPKMGATNFGYRLAEQFGLAVTDTRPALVPLTFAEQELAWMTPLAGISTTAIVSLGKAGFEEALLFTHRGLSGPAILQISSYWREGDGISIDMLPHLDVIGMLREARQATPKLAVQTVIAAHLPKRLAQVLGERIGVTTQIGDMSDKVLATVAMTLEKWALKPVGSEGYRTAEVTLGGVDTDELDARTMEAKAVPGLFIVGEVVDVTGWLGGYNFQWAWASGWAAGQAA
ncbi:MAG: rane protein [Devosia sp.]|nr:rane protein [Devosia sp.]